MHAKALVVDDEVITGSYNLSRHGEVNAENVLHILDEPTAVRFAEFADRVAARYRTALRPRTPDA
jgi:phosphatidylserine/phosphatidylglycerophosphate/cardiolipin synthase-like enzyme